MKLFTEKQVRQSFIAGMEFIAVDPLKYEQDANEYMNSITPIELPSDEEIRERAEEGDDDDDDDLSAADEYELGAIWMKEQILNQTYNKPIL